VAATSAFRQVKMLITSSYPWNVYIHRIWTLNNVRDMYDLHVCNNGTAPLRSRKHQKSYHRRRGRSGQRVGYNSGRPLLLGALPVIIYSVMASHTKAPMGRRTFSFHCTKALSSVPPNVIPTSNSAMKNRPSGPVPVFNVLVSCRMSVLIVHARSNPGYNHPGGQGKYNPCHTTLMHITDPLD
jgi:hypothetical protein